MAGDKIEQCAKSRLKYGRLKQVDNNLPLFQPKINRWTIMKANTFEQTLYEFVDKTQAD